MFGDHSEFYHYGVKGMKWGVRRQIAGASRTAARYQNEIARNKELLKMYSRPGRLPSSASDSRRRQAEKAVESYTSQRNKLVSKLSKKDIAQGEEEVNSLLKTSVTTQLLGRYDLDLAFDYVNSRRFLRKNRG